MRRYLLLLITFCTLSVAAIVVLQPDPLVRYEAELARLPPEEAILRLEERSPDEMHELNITLVHARLTLAEGDYQGANRLLEELAAGMPQDPGIRDDLADLAFREGNLDEAARHLSVGYEIEPTKDRRERLGLIWRLLRRHHEEISLLASVPPGKLSTWEADRLARLLAAAERTDELKTLYSALASSQSEYSKTAKRNLIVYFVDEGLTTEAVSTAMEWYAASDYDWSLAKDVISAFVSRGAIGEAKWFAEQSVELSPKTGYLLVGEFARNGHRTIARQLQDAFLSQTDRISTDEWVGLIDFAALTGDLRGLQTAIAFSYESDIPEAVLPDVLLQFLRYQGTRALVPYRHMATDRLSKEAPLIAAAFAVEQGRLETTVAHLVDASKDELSEWDRAIWLAMAQRLDGTGYDRQLLASGVPAELSAALIPHLR